jgi:prepilin-type N-terminal cleavage/methylation domain-containing protein
MNEARRAFTLIELLIVVSIIAILAVIAVFNMREATERALKSADAENLHTVVVALQAYSVDYGKLPPADCEAGPFSSWDSSNVRNAPAGGGSWNGVPWKLYELKYISNWETLFCPKYLKLYRGGSTLRGGYPRYHNFRYAYNRRTHLQPRDEAIANNSEWIVRDLWLDPRQGFYGGNYPRYPADYQYPWGEERDQELMVKSDGAVRLVRGGTDDLIR